MTYRKTIRLQNIDKSVKITEAAQVKMSHARMKTCTNATPEKVNKHVCTQT